MSKVLAISQDADTLACVLAETGRHGRVKILHVGTYDLPEAGESEDASSTPLAEVLRDVVGRLKVGRGGRLIVCVGRGTIESARFQVPPCDDEELPVIVRHLVPRQISGLSEDAAVDFISEPPQQDGSRFVSALAMSPADSARIAELLQVSGCASGQALVVTHPLRWFVPRPESDDDSSAAVVLSRSRRTAQILIVQRGRPVLSRSVRLAPKAQEQQTVRFLEAEIQRTILSAEDCLEPGSSVNRVVLAGPPSQTEPVAAVLRRNLDLSIHQVPVPDESVAEVKSGTDPGACIPLIAAVQEQAAGIRPAVDFLNPRQPVRKRTGRIRLAAAAAAVLLLAGGAAWHIHTLFADVQQRIAEIEGPLNDITDLLKKTSALRRQAAGIGRWDADRMSWLDELRDLTIRMPSSPDLMVSQFAATPSGRGYTVVFQGVTKSPEAHRAMELGIQDRYRTTSTPTFSQSGSGDDVVWNFQTTVKIQRRPRSSYAAHLQQFPVRTLVSPSGAVSEPPGKQTARPPDGSAERPSDDESVPADRPQEGRS